MSTTQYRCSNARRRTLVGKHATLNGIDFVEVFDLDAIPVPSPRQRSLLVRFLKPVPAVTVANIVIEGGVRVTPVKVLWAFVGGAVTAPPATAAEQAHFAALAQADHYLVVRTDSEGDFSTYRFRLVDAPGAALADLDLDPQLVTLDFTFKAECPSEFDCRPRDAMVARREYPKPAEPQPTRPEASRNGRNSKKVRTKGDTPCKSPQWEQGGLPPCLSHCAVRLNASPKMSRHGRSFSACG